MVRPSLWPVKRVGVGAKVFEMSDSEQTRVALVTGSGKGIGAACAIELAARGLDVVICSRTQADLDAVAQQVEAIGKKAWPVVADLSDDVGASALVEQALEAAGRVDVVVNNAGGYQPRPFVATRYRHLEAAFRFNVAVPFEISRLLVPQMLERANGSIVNIGSVAAIHPNRGYLAYSTAKAALSQMTRSMAADLAPKIRVNAVLPGAIETDALKWFLSTTEGETMRKTMLDKTRMRRNGTPEDIAKAVAFMALDDAAWITGKLLEVDGGAGDELTPMGIDDL